MLRSRSITLLPAIAIVAACFVLNGRAEEPKEQSGSRPLIISPGEKAQVSLFGIKAEGSKFVYVLDRSGSTEGKLLDAAKAEILASIEKVDDVHQFQLVVYNERPKIFNPAGSSGQLCFGTDANRAEAKKFLATISGDGGTDHAAALSAAIRLHPDVIFMLSDGDEPMLNAQQLGASRSRRRGHHHQYRAVRRGPQAGARLHGEAREAKRRRVYVRRYDEARREEIAGCRRLRRYTHLETPSIFGGEPDGVLI